MNRPMRIAVLSPRAHPWHDWGGLERHVFDLCRFLRREGVEIDLWISRPDHSVEPFAGDEGFRLQTVPGRPFLQRRFLVVATRSTLYPLFCLRMGRALRREAARRPVDAIVAQGLTALGALSLRTCAPILLNPHGMEEMITPSRAKRFGYVPFRALIRFAAARSARVVATDWALAPIVQRVLSVPKQRIVVLPNAVDVEGIQAFADRGGDDRVFARWGSSDACPRIVSVGRLAPNKGFLTALHALAAADRELGEKWCWVVVGDGPTRGQIEEVARSLGIHARVRLLGALGDEEKHALLTGADVFLNPTHYEGSSIVTLEAMAHALPVVATDAGGIGDKIEEGVTGWVARAGDAASLKGALMRCWSSEASRRRAVGLAAARRCEESFGWPGVAREWVRTLRALASEHRAEAGVP